MDTLRSCYVTMMRDGHGTVFPARWYFTDNPPLDKVHVYGSHNHIREQGDDDRDTGDPGEVWGAKRRWVDGSPPLASACEGPQGTDTAWLGELDDSGPFPPALWGAEFDDSYDDSYLSTTYVDELP
jgi:hypothetical protein